MKPGFSVRRVRGALAQGAAGLLALFAAADAGAASNVLLTGVPDYQWHLGCFGTATGNLFGYWDRHGFPNYYTGPTGGGVAPLNSNAGNAGIHALWASQAGVDGRPANLPGHANDYHVVHLSTAADPYQVAGRPEHPPDCVGDFIGLSQRKWSDLNGECEGNIDGYAFNFFEPQGARRENFTPPPLAGLPVEDIQSGLREWSRFRGYAADTVSQLSDFNPQVQPGEGFSFADLKAEIDAGYPVLLFMQPFDEFSRTVAGKPHLNPEIHAMLAYGYVEEDDGGQYVRYRTSWASGDNQFSRWIGDNWTPDGTLNLPLRGVICFRPRPSLQHISRTGSNVTITWHGPASELRDELAETETPLHWYVVEQASSPDSASFQQVTQPTTQHQATVSVGESASAFFRVRIVPPPQ